MEDISRIRIVPLEVPVAERGLLSLLWHKGSPWIDDIGRRMEGKYPGSLDRFLVAYDGPVMAAQVWYTVSAADPRTGLLGHVFTRPEYRRRRLSTRLMEAALEQFTREGGLLMQLFTYNPHTLPFYERLGFETICASRVAHAADWYMRSPVGAQRLLDQWLAGRDCRIRPLAPADLPQYCLLYNVEYQTRLKDRAQGIGLGLETELTFITSIEKTGRGAAACCVLDNGQAIAGIGSLACSDFPHQSHVGLVDCYTHPGFRARAGELIEAALDARRPLGVEIVYALAVDDAKREMFAALGFRHLGRLARHYRVDGQLIDCDLYQL
jgi:GNAT superfamily N-acetyltransferase